jgi:hypothetical protein
MHPSDECESRLSRGASVSPAYATRMRACAFITHIPRRVSISDAICDVIVASGFERAREAPFSPPLFLPFSSLPFFGRRRWGEEKKGLRVTIARPSITRDPIITTPFRDRRRGDHRVTRTTILFRANSLSRFRYKIFHVHRPPR